MSLKSILLAIFGLVNFALSSSVLASDLGAETSRTNYRVDLTSRSHIDVTVSIKWSGLDHIEVYPFENSECAAASYSQPEVVEGADEKSLDFGSPVRVTKPPSAESLTLRYKIVPKYGEGTFAFDQFESCLPTILTEDYFVLDSKWLLPFFKLFDLDGVRTRLGNSQVEWLVDDGWGVAQSQIVKDRPKSLVRDTELRSTIFAGGAIRNLSPVQTGNEHTSFFTSSDLIPTSVDLSDTVEFAKRTFAKNLWPQTFERGNSTLIVRARGSPGESLFGIARYGLQILILSKDFDPVADKGLVTELAAHELLHSWLPFGFSDRPYALPIWFREGVVEYLAFRFVVEQGLHGPQPWASRLNRALSNHATDPYQVGFLRAFALDHVAPSDDPGSLEASLTRMRNTSLASTDPLSEQLILDAFDIEASSAFHAVGDISLPCEFRMGEENGSLMTGRLPAYFTGLNLDFEVDDGSLALITSVAPDSPAYKAGLRTGDQVLALVSGGSENVFEPLVLEVKPRRGASKDFSFWPHGQLRQTSEYFYISEGTAFQSNEMVSACRS